MSRPTREGPLELLGATRFELDRVVRLSKVVRARENESPVGRDAQSATNTARGSGRLS